MNGGPSHIDTFDPKPMLTKYHGKALPGPNLRTERKTGAALGSPFAFRKYGQTGIEVSELFARTAEKHIDDLCIVRSMYADVPNHEPSLMLMNCGDGRLQRPSMGAWITPRALRSTLDVPMGEHPWLPFAGMFRNDSLVEEWKRILAELRRQADETEHWKHGPQNCVDRPGKWLCSGYTKRP
jgi:hypothetical protein